MTETVWVQQRRHTQPRLGEMLIEEGLVTEDDVDQALLDQERTGDRLGRILVRRGLITEVQLIRAISAHAGFRFADLDVDPGDLEVRERLPESYARRFQALPIGWDGDKLLVAMANPSDIFAVDDLGIVTGCNIIPVMVEPDQLARAIHRTWHTGIDTDESLRLAHEEAEDSDKGSEVRKSAGEAPVVQFVNQLLGRAIHARASDIHLEPTGTELRVRFRIDGVLHDVLTVPLAIQNAVTSRLKILSDIDIAERRIPQDGRVSLQVDGRQVDVRVVTLPTTFGESLVLRILDKGSGVLSIKELDFLPETLERYRDAYRRPGGCILVTGPTGSGKSTTLYATLSDLNDPRRNIITVEDPIEYRLPGVKQMQVHRKAGLTFASALRAILRADPDIVLVGEVRDAETIRIATEAALTGHLVLTSIHTNDAAATPARLLDMGVEPYLVSSAVSCIVAQRLARRLCEKCKEPHTPDFEELDAVEWPFGYQAATGLYQPTGCESCGGAGYQGRFAIYEVMTMTDELRRLVLERATAEQVRQLAVRQGMLTMRMDGLRRAREGQTSIEEILRVTS